MAHLIDRLRGAAAGLALLGLFVSPASAAAPAAPRTGASDLCQTVMGLAPGDARFEACRQTLVTRIERIGEGRAAASSREACLKNGLTPGTSDFAVCSLQDGPPQATAPVAASVSPSGPYFRASNSERRQRQRLACALVGFEPDSTAFETCVASLAAALFQADNPMN